MYTTMQIFFPAEYCISMFAQQTHL